MSDFQEFAHDGSSTYSAGDSQASRLMRIRLLCLCGKLTSFSRKNPTSSQYFRSLYTE